MSASHNSLQIFILSSTRFFWAETTYTSVSVVLVLVFEACKLNDQLIQMNLKLNKHKYYQLYFLYKDHRQHLFCWDTINIINGKFFSLRLIHLL